MKPGHFFEHNTDKLPQPGRWKVFILVAIGTFMATLDGAIVNIAVPTIMRELGVSVAAIQWVVIIYLLVVTSLLLSFGRLSDIHGRRRVYSVGLAVFALSSLLCGAATTIGWLIAARFLQGLGAAMIMACSPALIVDAFPPTERGRALGTIGAVVASGLTMGPVLGGLLLHYFSWRAIFFINIPIGLITAVIVNVLLKNSTADVTRNESFDWPGAVMLALCLGPLLLAITHGHEWGCQSPAIVLLLVLSLTSAAGLAWVEKRARHPLLDKELFAIRLFSLPILSAIIVYAGLFSVVFLMPFYLLNPSGFPVDEAGYVMATLFLLLFVISPLAGAISDRIGSRFLCTSGCTILAIALFLLAKLPAETSVIDIVWRLALAGIGLATFISPNSSATMSSVPPQRRGVASATVAAARNLGMVLGVAFSGTVFANTFAQLTHGAQMKNYVSTMEPAFMTAFHTAMLCSVGLAAVGIIVAWLRGPEGKKVGGTHQSG
ncbi:MAG: MFS transporter [Desulfopila sp.]